MSFPSIQNPSVIKKTKSNNTISVEFDGGYKAIRNRYSREIYIFEVTFNYLSEDDKNALEEHIDDVGLTTQFEWINVEENKTYTVRYAEYFEITADASHKKLYNVTIKLETV